MYWPSLEDTLLFQKRMIQATGGLIGVLNKNTLEAALHRPFSTACGQELYPTPALKVAALIEGIITMHPFLDGNKRTGIYLGLAVMKQNFPVIREPTDAEIEEIAVAVAIREVTMPQLAEWLKSRYECF